MIRQGECARLQLQLFGGPRVRDANGPVSLSPQQIGLVTLVYGHGAKGVTRLQAARLLLPANGKADARQRIRQLLFEVRSSAGRELIDTEGDRLLPARTVQCDLTQFEEALEGGSLREAASMAKAGFADMPLASVAEDYEDWCLARGAALLRLLRVRALTRWNECFERGDWDGALDAAEALHSLVPMDPQAVQRVIEALGCVGRSAAAEGVFAAYLESLGPEREPTAEIQDAIRRVRRLKSAVPEIPGAARQEVPLVGRRDALTAARRVFDQVKRGHFDFVLISGESGIGKTRVLQELQREAILRDFRCLGAQAVELERQIPLNLLLDALKPVDLRPHLSALGRPWSLVIGAVLPPGALADPPDELPPIQDSALPRRLLDSFSLLLERLAEEQPTLLFLDDLQWADATTVAALRFVQRRWTGGPLGIIATVCPELVAPADPVAKYLSGADDLAIRQVELRELSAGEGRQLVDHIGEGSVGEEHAERICALAGLHPLYLTELTRDYLAGSLEFPKLPVDQVTIPVSLKQILDGRLLHLSPKAKKVAGLLAVGARAIRLPLVADLLKLTLEEAADSVEELKTARLVDTEQDRVRIIHELFRSAIYRHLSEPRRAINHRSLAALIQAEGDEEPAGELAIHYARAGEAALAAKYAWAAASRAMGNGAVTEAAHFFQLVTENEGDAVKRAEATAELARALYLTRDITRANPLLELAASRLRAAGKPAEALRMEIRRVEGLVEVGTEGIPDLLERLRPIKREAWHREEWESVALALDAELHLLHRDGDVEGIRLLFEEMRVVSQKGSLEAALVAHAGLALGVLFDDPDEAMRAATHAVGLAGRVQNYRLTALMRLLVVLHYRGLLVLPSSVQIAEEARSLAERSGDVLLRFSLEGNMAVAALDAGDLERAEVMMARSSAMLGSADMDLNRFNQANNRAELAMAQHDFASAEEAFSNAASYLGLTTPAYMHDLVNAGLGLCALETGALSEARRREQNLNEPPSTWYYDPTTIVAFRSRILELRGCHEEARDLLTWSADDLEDRLVLAWLKVRALLVRLLKKRDPRVARSLAEECRGRADELGLHHRSRDFGRMLASIERARVQS